MTDPICRCGRVKERAGRPDSPYWVCRPCLRERLAAKRNYGRGGSPKPVAGARESLARYLNSHWAESLSRIAELLEHPYSP